MIYKHSVIVSTVPVGIAKHTDATRWCFQATLYIANNAWIMRLDYAFGVGTKQSFIPGFVYYTGADLLDYGT